MPLPKPPAVRTVAASPMCPAEWNRAMPLNTAARGRPGNIFTIISVRTPKAPSSAARSTTSAVTEPSQSWGLKPPTISRVRRPTVSRYSRRAPTSIFCVSSVTSGLVMPMPKSGRLMPSRFFHASSNTCAWPANIRLTMMSSARAMCNISHASEFRSSRGRTRICSSVRPANARSAADILLPPTAAECIAACWSRNRSRMSMSLLLSGATVPRPRRGVKRGGLQCLRRAAEEATMDDRQLEAREAANVARTLERVHDADVAEALNAIDPPAAARVLGALPFDLAVRALNQPELDRRARLFEHLPTDRAAVLVGAMSADQRTDLFRELPERTAARLLSAVDTGTRESLRALLSYPPTTAGGIMTTEHVEAPATWTVERTLVQIRSGGHPRRPVYAVYVLDPVDRRLVHTVTLRELVLADPTRTLLEVGDRHPPVTVHVWTDREETAR